MRFACLIAFSSELEGSLNILGRNNFFLPFLITFHEKAQKVIIETESKDHPGNGADFRLPVISSS
jgi:hypothetical protein